MVHNPKNQAFGTVPELGGASEPKLLPFIGVEEDNSSRLMYSDHLDMLSHSLLLKDLGDAS
ncbi:hypothetical protein MUK42_32787 [Musa troglodytarum]|uniref:Uncharacterized protein n=1 Tax=Musa troglodytarum TaxID=320322 RepID=A0A9E7LDX8_9LILI|nr:hypothetical protein MUK42_32787 [Musa troglodytarum]